MKKNSKLQMVTVKKQNNVIEYVCCKSATTRDPIHVSYPVFAFMHSNPAQADSCPCVPVNACSMAEHGPEAAPNLKQLPYRMRQNSSMRSRYKDGTEAAENWFKGVALYSSRAGQAVTELLLCLAPASLLFFQGRGEYF